MKNNNSTVRSSLLFPSSLLIGAALISGLYLLNQSGARKYSSAIKVESTENGKDNDAAGMEQYFFDARKNNITGKMDYAAMSATESQIAGMAAYRSSHRLASGGLNLSWKPLGPSNVGGRTRAILVDNQDPSGNTLFAAAVSGGIWKSVNGGATWDSVNDRMGSLIACDLAEDANGNIYCGTGEGFSVIGYATGEGFSCGMLGDGIFKSNDHGKSFYHLASTTPSVANNTGAKWAYTNRIAVSPCNPNVIYAATNTAIWISKDSGNTWKQGESSATKKVISANVLDLKISNDGSVIVASVNGAGYVAKPNCAAEDTTIVFTPIKTSGAGKLPNGGRIEFAISPSNSSIIY
ncbi:MAG TPA: sialidase family protein, partial [Bacteroidia bacterium]|nr:sialidase family protein [Bacteroidia bacterium]